MYYYQVNQESYMLHSVAVAARKRATRIRFAL